MVEHKLRPCPRCGGEAKILVAPPTSHMSDESFAVECSKCLLIGVYCPNRTMAAAWWNERPAEQAKPCHRCKHHPGCGLHHRPGPDCADFEQREPEPTRNAAAPLQPDGPAPCSPAGRLVTCGPFPPQHQCPYGGRSEMRLVSIGVNSYTTQSPLEYARFRCGGSSGWLCERCKEDRADARQQQEHKFLREMTDANVDRLRAATFHQIGERWEETQARLDDLCRLLDKQMQRIDQLEDRQPEPLTPMPLSEDDLAAAQDEPTQHGEARTCEGRSSEGRPCTLLPKHDGPHRNGGCQWWDTPYDEPEARTCGNCGHLHERSGGQLWDAHIRDICGAPLPMWAGQGDVNVPPGQDATHCAAWTPKEAKA